MVSQHRLESFFHEITCNGMTSFVKFKRKFSRSFAARVILITWKILCFRAEFVTEVVVVSVIAILQVNDLAVMFEFCELVTLVIISSCQKDTDVWNTWSISICCGKGYCPGHQVCLC